MPKVYPFRGLYYNTEQVGDLNNVVTPPYDQFGAEQGEVFLNRSQYNIAHLIGTHIKKDEADAYQKSRDLLTSWIQEGAIKQEEKPVFYAYHQDYIIGNTEQKIRKGFVAVLGLEDYGKNVFPHEMTFPGPKADRLKLLETMEASFGQIMMSYEDAQQEVEKLLAPFCQGSPDFRVIDDLGVLHLLWRISDEKTIAAAQAVMSNKSCLIADGHHRYEAARLYKAKMAKEKRPCEGSDSCDNVLATFINSVQDDGIALLATHRLIHSLPKFNLREFKQKLAIYFDMIPYASESLAEEFIEDLRFEGQQKNCFGFYAQEEDVYYILRLKDSSGIENLLISKHASLQKLDTVLLHEVLLQKFLGIPHDNGKHKKFITYERKPETVLQRVRQGDFTCAFLVNPLPIAHVHAVAQSGNVLPQKSTDFYPKLLTGIVGHSFDFKQS